MIRSVCAVLILILCFCGTLRVSRGQNIDPRNIPIGKSELRLTITSTPITSEKHLMLISRAMSSDLLAYAGDVYRELKVESKDKPSLDLWRGVVASRAFRSYIFLEKIPYDRIRSAFQDAKTYLGEACKALPKSAIANLEYGYFLWQYGSDMKRGKEHVNIARSLQPDNPRVLAYMGDMKSNPSGNMYDMASAEKDLLRAIEIDKSYAYPHLLLARLYRDKHQRQRAESALRDYLALCPAAEAERKGIKWLANAIARLP
jgi:tetratricopeptide (TPR) repeat protein